MSQNHTTSIFKPLYLIERMLHDHNMTITYVYDDLVFVEHSDVLFRFDDTTIEHIQLRISSSVNDDTVESIKTQWMTTAKKHAISLQYAGRFTVEQLPGKEELTITFSDR